MTDGVRMVGNGTPETDEPSPAAGGAIEPTGRRVALLAADVGNTKTDLVLVGADGAVLAAVRGPTASHQRVGHARAGARLAALAAEAAERIEGIDPRGAGPGGDAALAAIPIARLAVLCAAGADTPADHRRICLSLRARGLADRIAVFNDTDAGLRAGSPEGWGVVLVCGAGTNCLGVAPNGRTARVLAYGPISGDWGGGRDIGVAAVGAAIRGRDRRGPRTLLETSVPAQLGVRRPTEIPVLLATNRMERRRVHELVPVVFAAAGAGDAVSRGILDRVADELAVTALAAMRRLGIVRQAVPVVLSGGVFRADDPAFHARIAERIHAAAPRAEIVRLELPPVAGAALLGLDALGADAATHDRLRATIATAQFDGG